MDTTQEKTYQITFHILEENAEEIKRALQKVGGSIIEEKPPQKVALSYPIKKQKFSFMGIIMFKAMPESIVELNADLKLSKVTIRHLVNVVCEKNDRQKKKKGAEYPSGDGPLLPIKIKSFDPILTNEALEKKIEEILQ